MTNKMRYSKKIDGKEYESTLNVMETYVRPYASFAPEFGKEFHVGEMGSSAVEKAESEKTSSMEKSE